MRIEDVKQYGDCKVTVYKPLETFHPYPWNFEIEYKGKTHKYGGVPNQCATKRSALKRAWWRCKWLQDGTYNKRYI